MRRVVVSLAALVVLVSVTRVQGALSPGMFAEPVPVLMDPPWVPAGTYDPAKPTVTADGQRLSFKQYLPFKVYTAEWNEPNQRWENVTYVPIGQSWCGSSHIVSDPDTHERKWLFYGGSSGAAADIYRSSWLGDHWGGGVRIAAVNDPFETVDEPYFHGSRLYFNASNDQPDHNAQDLYYSDYDPDNGFGVPVRIDAVNDPNYLDYSPALSPDGQTLFWHSNRPGGYGGNDIWMSNWESDSWGLPINLGPTINTGGDEGYPSFNGARNSLYFQDSDGVLVESVVPEPSTLVLLSMGAVGLLAYTWRRRRR